jgi:hypothetical protein
LENQHTLIKGYRDLTEAEIAAMNAFKDVAQNVGNMLTAAELLPDVDARWLAIATTDLQKGFMAAIRAIARPTTF